MKGKAVTSREYKLILNTDRFVKREQAEEQFLALLGILVGKSSGEILRHQNDEFRRHTWYLDTPEFALNQAGYSLRARKEENGDRFLTLKYRGGDRYLSAVQDVTSPEAKKTKFEEDVMPPFGSKFSHSTTVAIKKKEIPDTIDEVIAIFPGLDELPFIRESSIKKANKFKAFEVVRHLCTISFGDKKCEVKAALSHWFVDDTRNGWPLVTEFSFDYDARDGDGEKELERFPTKTVMGSNALFKSLQLQTGWWNPHGSTKTAYALDGI